MVRRNGQDVDAIKVHYNRNAGPNYINRIEAKSECHSSIALKGPHKWDFKTITGLNEYIEQKNIFIDRDSVVIVKPSPEGFRHFDSEHPEILGEVLQSDETY
ncbi:MAG: hypothetical protein EOP33_00690 [Rickettsiaceae bacterium]|nr:MAG: hypothetical protein EOP33_00690 [Rickettsiaceae bacterium]